MTLSRSSRALCAAAQAAVSKYKKDFLIVPLFSVARCARLMSQFRPSFLALTG